MDDDPYGFCYHLEKDAAKVFDDRPEYIRRKPEEALAWVERGNEALDAAGAERTRWHEKAIEASKDSALEGLSHYTTERAGLVTE